MSDERDEPESEAPSTARPEDFRTSTRQSALNATSRIAPFADPTSPEATLIREVQASFRSELEQHAKNLREVRDRNDREIDRVGRMADVLWVRVVGKEPPASAEDVDQTELLPHAPKPTRTSRPTIIVATALAAAAAASMIVLEILILVAVLEGRR